MSIRNIARLAELSPATVSLALRGNPRISEATKRRVQRLAKRLGYKPNAKVAELMGQVRASRESKIEACLGVISFYDSMKPWEKTLHLSRIYVGMKKRAEALGYRLEPFGLRAPGMTYRRFRSILDARGIVGLLSFGSPKIDEEFPDEFDRYAIVTQGLSIKTPIHRVINDAYDDIRFALNKVHQMGYRRPGLAIGEYEGVRGAHAHLSAYLGWCETTIGTPGAMPVLKLNQMEEAPLINWLKQNRPDVVILVHHFDMLAEFTSILRRNGIRFPRDLGVAAISQILNDTGLSGLEENQQIMGEWAVELLVSRLMNSDFGIPTIPRIEMVKSRWIDGQSLERQRRTHKLLG